jgi:hypothetical protein
MVDFLGLEPYKVLSSHDVVMLAMRPSTVYDSNLEGVVD